MSISATELSTETQWCRDVSVKTSNLKAEVSLGVLSNMNKKWANKRITINLAAIEAEKLSKYCEKTGRPATDVIRELIRRLSVCE